MNDEARFARLMPFTHGALRALVLLDEGQNLIPGRPGNGEGFIIKARADRSGRHEQLSAVLGSCAASLGSANNERFENDGPRSLEREMHWFGVTGPRVGDGWQISVDIPWEGGAAAAFEVRMVVAEGPGSLTVRSWRAPEVSDDEACRLVNAAMAARASGASWKEVRAGLRESLEDRPLGPRR